MIGRDEEAFRERPERMTHLHPEAAAKEEAKQGAHERNHEGHPDASQWPNHLLSGTNGHVNRLNGS